ncbi:hypothetical protein [Intestinimonas butyriciproducens]|uniref:Copper amine oxidase-like protein n=1 Tax=Intestinimonas butyriciproducens TaxID=1297617 RepID=A0A2U1CBW8_9FIRM|nr:hypothetical protein [Intestinimonas butyriciproducens]MCI6362888.1 hypothetical protein [Intestinimonas butyriciproducens]MCR1906263.1 hypothetical protein [Intestinimonas butyriciproducens]PVY58423.1 hypothetical protein C7373_10416 [Intestinimonas butyriciproducens]QBB65441.1 hypothetical protein SRB521_01180 [Intestinimonas butyriciproducens]
MHGKSPSFAAGFTAAALLFGGGTALAATVLTAAPSTQTFCVDGQEAALEAYVIRGHNYVQLRDIGRAVDFGVTYDGAANIVRIDSAAPYVEESPTTGTLTVPQSDEPFRPLAGDVVQLDDGTTLTVTGPKKEEPALPEPTCDWSQFPNLELPVARTIHWENGTVTILNLHETRRMQYTIYNSVPNCPELWESGKLRRDSKGEPIFHLALGIEVPTGVQPFWPWRDEQSTQVFYSAPAAQFAVEAWDTYNSMGKFLYTCYYVQGL